MLLGVNIDHVATLRQARRGIEPDPVLAAAAAANGGADSIVAHLREDRRHIQDNDIVILRRALRIKFNLEMSIAPEIVAIACRVKPDQATLVPERRQEITTEGGLDVAANFTAVEKAVKKLAAAGIAVSLFIDPEKKQIDAAKKCGAGLIELHTGSYSNAKSISEEDRFFEELAQAAGYAAKKDIRTFAGHGLDYRNVMRICSIPQIEELNIGHAIISRAVFTGLEKAVREMKEIISSR